MHVEVAAKAPGVYSVVLAELLRAQQHIDAQCLPDTSQPKVSD